MVTGFRPHGPAVREGRFRWFLPLALFLGISGFFPVSGLASITLVQHTSKDAGIVSSSSLAFPANNTAGNWIAVVIRGGHANQVFTVSDTGANTYHQAVQMNQTLDAPNGETLAIFYAENIASGINTVTVSESLANNTLRFTILEYSGVATAGSLDVTSAAQGSGTTLNSGTATTTASGDLILGEVTTADGVTYTAGSGYSIEETVPAAPKTKLIAEDAIQLTAGAVSVGATLSVSDNGGVLLAAFKPTTGTLPPNITSVTPNSGPVGTSVTVAGANFGGSQGASAVTFNGVSAGSASNWSASSITVNVPSGATSGNVVVTVGGQASNGVSFTVAVPASITATAGTPQSATVNAAFAAPLQATVKDASSNPVSNVTVTFAAPGSGPSGTFAGGVTTATTNAQGVATSAVLTANSTAGGPYTVTASVSGVSTPANFSLTNLAGTPASVTATGGTPQSTAVNTAFASQLQVTVKDASSNPVSNVTVTFAAPGSGPSGTFAGGVTTATTNAQGVATSVVFTANSTAGGPYTVTASVSGVSTPANFSLTNLAGTPASVTATGGTPQSTAVNTAFASQLQVTVKDASSNPVSNVTVTFAAPGSGPSGTFAGGVTTATTNAQGVATSVVFTANSTAGGPYTVTASVSGVSTPANFSLTNLAGAPASITLVQHTSKDAGTTSPTSLAFPSANTAGNWIAVVIRGGKSGQVFTVSDSLHNTYKTASQFNVTVDTPNGDTLAIFYVENIAGGSNIVTVANSISGNTIRFAILEYSGVALANSIDAVVTGQGTSTTPNSGNATTSANGDLLIGTAMTGGPNTFTAGSGYQTEELVPAAPNSKLMVEDQVQTSAGSASATASLAVSDRWGAILAAFKAVSGGGTPAPSLSSLTPNSGPVGASVTIAGANFSGSQGSNTVTFNGVSAGTASNWSASSITVNVPSGATTGSVIVTVGGVQSNRLNFTVTSTAPSISSLTPNNGPVGTAVTIAGANFGAPQGTSTVTFNGISAGTASNWSASSITVNVPSGATTGNVVVTVGGQASNSLTFTVTPSISSLTPNNGPVGTSVTIAGANFGSSQGTSTVTFSGVSAGTASNWSASSITVNVPPGATTGSVVVTVGGVQSNGLTFTVTSTAPSISSLTPNNGPVGTPITIAGANFGGSQGSSTVTFNGISAGTASNWGASSITVNVPSGASSSNVVVTVGGIASNGLNFTVTVPSTNGISLVQHTSIDGGITSSASLAFSSSTTSGNFIVVVIRGGKPAQVFTVSDSRGNTYRQAIQVNLTVDGETMAIYYAESISGGANTVTVSESIPNNTLRFAILEYSGVAPSGSLDVTVSGQGSDTEANSGNTATTTVGDLLIAEMTNGDGTGYGAGAGFTAEEMQPAAPNSKLFVEDGILPLPSVTAATASMAGVHNWGALMAAFKPATGSAGPHIVNVSPGTAPAGALVTIAGTNFSSSQGASTVTFNGTAATPRAWSSTAIVVPVPAGAASGNVVVTVAGTPSNGVNFTVGFAPPIAFVQVNSSLTEQGLVASLSFVTVPFKGAQTTGNLNVVFVGWHDSTATISSVTDSAGNVYTQAGTTSVLSGAASQAIYYAKDILPSPPNFNVVAVTFNGLASNPDVRIAEYTGLDPINPLDVSVNGQGSGATSNSGSVSTTNANDLLVSANVVSASAPSSAAGAGYTSRVISENGGILEDRIVAATASYNATASLAASGNWIMQMAAFKAPSAAAPAISVTLSPGSANTATGYGSQSFGASLANDVQRLGVTWTLSGTGCSGISCGSLSNITSTSVTYLAPANLPSPATVTLTATSVADPTKSAAGTITVTQGALNVTITPKRGAVTLTQVQQFSAPVSNDPANGGVVWSVDGNNGGNSTSGTISSTGLFTPGTQAGVHTVTATSASNASVNASATIAVTDFAGAFSYHYNAQSTGQNTQEYALTPSTVNSSTFGLLFSCPVDGFMFATPLYVPNMTFGAQKRNVVFIATEHNSVYAFDADSPNCTQLWKTSFLSSGVLTVSPNDTGDGVSLVTEFGITSTPVIDPASNTIYVVANTREIVGSGCSASAPCFIYRLHALDLTTGTEKFGGPVVITAPNFNPLFQLQRPGLLLNNGTVYIGFGSHADLNNWQGWLFAYTYNGTSLAQVYAWSSTVPTGGNNEGAIWGAGNPPVADASGNVYVVTGNGTFDGTQNYSDSVVKLSPAGTVADYFTPFDQSTLSVNDIDLGSSGAIILPDAVGSSTHQHLALATGKVGVLYLLDQTKLGKFNSGSNADVQEVNIGFNVSAPDMGFFGQPAYWNGNLYTVMTADSLRQFPISNGVVTNPASSVASKVYTYRGATPSVSSSGITNGIVWVEDITDYQSKGPTLLDAYDASHVATMLYTSPVNGAGAACSTSKFTVPVVANGKVYISGSNCFSVFGLLPN